MQRVYLRLGEILVRHGVINLEQMHQALCIQRQDRKPIGDILQDQGLVTISQVNAALVEQEWRSTEPRDNEA